MMFQNVFIISITTSFIIILLLLFSPIINKRYSAKWRYFVWLVLAIRLVIPIRFDIPAAPISLDVQDMVIYPRHSAIDMPANEQLSQDNRIFENYTESQNQSNVIKETETAKTSRVLTMLDLVKIAWGLIAVLYFLYHILMYAVTKYRLKSHLKRIDENIYQCNKISGPVMMGFFKPTILIPDKEYTIEERDLIIRHEKMHFKRKDTWYKLLLLAVNAIHWFNPIIYIMIRCANRDMEYACDNDVVKDRDMEYKKKYSLTILKSMEK